MICYRRELTRARQKQECSGQKKKKKGGLQATAIITHLSILASNSLVNCQSL